MELRVCVGEINQESFHTCGTQGEKEQLKMIPGFQPVEKDKGPCCQRGFLAADGGGLGQLDRKPGLLGGEDGQHMQMCLHNLENTPRALV